MPRRDFSKEYDEGNLAICQVRVKADKAKTGQRKSIGTPFRNGEASDGRRGTITRLSLFCLRMKIDFRAYSDTILIQKPRKCVILIGVDYPRIGTGNQLGNGVWLFLRGEK